MHKGTDRGGTRCLGRAAGGLQGTVRLERGAEKLSRLHITAPFTGKLIPAKDSDDKDVSFRVGEQVSGGQVIGYMVNDRQMKLTLAFSANMPAAFAPDRRPRYPSLLR